MLALSEVELECQAGLDPSAAYHCSPRLQLYWSVPCRLIKDFEREARVDNMSATDLATRKKALVQELNSFITTKKEFTQMQAAKQELIGAGGTPTKGGAGLQQRSKDGVVSCASLQSVQAGP